MSTYHYRTSDPAKLKAVADHEAAVESLRDKSRAFAASFGNAVSPVYSNSLTGLSFHDVKFMDSTEYDGTLLDKALWTVGTSATNYSRHPRSRVPARYRELQNQLQEKWDSGRPCERIDRDPIFELLGRGWGDFMFGGGFAYFVHDGSLYIEAGVSDKTGELEEILTSTFRAVKDVATAKAKEAGNEPA